MEITGGQLTQTSFNPALPGSTSTGPLIVGNIMNTSGTALAGLAEDGPGYIANQGLVVAVQACSITQAGTATAFTTPIVLPAQSIILQIYMYVSTAWTGGSTTYSITDTASATYSTANSGATVGAILVGPGTVKAQVQKWTNVGNTDVNLVVTSGNTGSGLGLLVVRYAQGMNCAIPQ
jgi:hypothetical protein